MNWQQLLVDGYGRVLQILERALGGLTQDDLKQRPHPENNSIGWLTWHLTRVQDGHLADLIGEKQLWISDDWHARFSRAADPSDTGFGHRPEDLAAFKPPDVETLLGYHRAVLKRTQRYITGLSLTDLDRKLKEPLYQPLPTVGVRLISVMSDNLQHAGQVAYLRGLLKNTGKLSV